MLRIQRFFTPKTIAFVTIALLAGRLEVASAQSNPRTASETSPGKAGPVSPQKARVSTGVMLGLVEHKTMPVYPDEAIRKGIQGDVIFKVEVDETGKVTSIVPVDGDPLLLAAGNDSLLTFRFRPFLLDGTPVKIQSQLGFHFSTQKAADGVNGHVECMASIPGRP
jgi:Gram-negative bacterial TonB protein C-terminal